MSATHCLVLFYISTEYHQNIPKSFRVTERTQNLFQIRKSFLEKTYVPTNPAIVVILVRNTSSRPILHLYQISSKYTKGYSCYRAETRNQIQTQEGEITPKVKQGSLKDSYIPHRRMTMEQPQNSRLKLVAFNCDLDLESALLSYGFCTSSH